MAHIANLQAGLYTWLAYNAAAGRFSGEEDLVAAFQTQPTVVRNIREFPDFDETAGNKVDVPSYDTRNSASVNAQADVEVLEFVLNFNPEQHNALEIMSHTGLTYAFQIALTNKVPVNLMQVPDSGIGLNDTENTVFNFAAVVAGFSVIPSLSDSLTAKVSLALQTEMIGPFTYGAVPGHFLTAPNGDPYLDANGEPFWI